MIQNNTVAVLDGKDLEDTIHKSFPDWRVIRLSGSAKARSLIRERSVGMFMMQVGAGNAGFRALVREAARHEVPSLFVAESQREYSAVRKVVANAPPTIQAVFGRTEVRSMVNILRDRLTRVHGRASAAHSVPAMSSGSDLDQHPLIQETTWFLRNPATGRLDARRIAHLYGEPLKRFAKALDVSPSAVTQTPDSQKYQQFLSRFERVARILPMLDSKDQFSAWVKAPNRQLRGEAPIDFLWGSPSRASKLADIVEDVLVGQPD
jgi:hypothetical protein